MISQATCIFKIDDQRDGSDSSAVLVAAPGGELNGPMALSS